MCADTTPEANRCPPGAAPSPGGESQPVTVCFLSRRLQGTIALQWSQQLKEVTDERTKVDPASQLSGGPLRLPHLPALLYQNEGPLVGCGVPCHPHSCLLLTSGLCFP